MFTAFIPLLTFSTRRFTVYDFSQSKRMSYYPHNQPIVNAGHEREDELARVSQSANNTLLPTATIGERSLAGSPPPDMSVPYMPPLPMPRWGPLTLLAFLIYSCEWLAVRCRCGAYADDGFVL